MVPWRERAPEERRSLNPALITQVVRVGVAGHQQEVASGLPYALAFPLVAIVMHAETRAALPRAVSTSLVAWVREHELIRYQIGPRTSEFGPLIREGILLGLRTGAVELMGGALTAASSAAPRATGHAELDELLRAAHKVGRWFAKVGSASTTLTLLGIQV
jgi:hypothetical protein